MLKGSCLCGAITFEIEGSLSATSYCHCGQCRKQTGHYWASGIAAKSELSVNGDVSWYASSDYARRGFCGTCGSSLFWDMPSDDTIAVCLGALDGETGLSVEKHIFVKDKGDYYELTDDLPKIQKY